MMTPHPHGISYKSALRRRKMIKFGRLLAYTLIGIDAMFSYRAIYTASGSAEMAIGFTIAIGASQWITSEALFGGRFDGLFRRDSNFDGTTDVSEWIKWGAKVGVLVFLYFINIATNWVGFDQEGMGRLFLAAPGVPDSAFLGGAFSLACACLLTFADEFLHSLLDASEAQLDPQLPELMEREARLRARSNAAECYTREMGLRGAEDGSRRGRTDRI